MNSPTVVESILNHELMLNESIDHFIALYKKGCTDFSGIGSIFLRLVQKMENPPLEITWFYSAMTFHSSFKSVNSVKDLFQLLVSCSGPYNGLKKVAVLAPVVCELYYVVVDCLDKGVCLKTEIEGLVEGIVSYIILCCSNVLEEWGNGLDELTGGFGDLVRVWTVGRAGEKCEFGDGLRVFFPLVSDEVCGVVRAGCGVGYLAGVVMVEAFLLRLCLKFGSRDSREELQTVVWNLAVQTTMGFQNCCFFDILLRMLLEPSLPVTTLLSSEDELLLRKVLYDVVIVGEYSFLKSQMWTQLSFPATWLLVADRAVQFVRESGDQIRAISYIDAFSKSGLPNQLIKWVSNQTGLEEKISRPNVSTPKALIRWLLVLEDQGVRVFDHNISKFHATPVICKSKTNHEIVGAKADGGSPNTRILFGMENNQRGQDKVDEDQEMVDWLDDAFVPADCMGYSAAAERRRKRKEGIPEEEETRFKLAKFGCDEGLVGEMCLPRRDDNLNCGNEVEVQSMG